MQLRNPTVSSRLQQVDDRTGAPPCLQAEGRKPLPMGMYGWEAASALLTLGSTAL